MVFVYFMMEKTMDAVILLFGAIDYVKIPLQRNQNLRVYFFLYNSTSCVYFAELSSSLLLNLARSNILISKFIIFVNTFSQKCLTKSLDFWKSSYGDVYLRIPNCSVYWCNCTKGPLFS